MSQERATARPYGLEDIAVWPDGTYAELELVWRGDFDWMSDDYEVVRHDDYARMRALGLNELADEYEPG